MLKGFEPRLYQQTILSTCSKKNTLVVIPTGLGKTGIGMLLAAHRLEEIPKGKIVFLAPTKPLVQQHKKTFEEFFERHKEEFVLFTGEVTPSKRKELWDQATFAFSTPQGFENDVISRNILLDDVSLIVFDESHRAAGDYAYVFIADQYMKRAKNPLILGLTASPGGDVAKIKEVCQNLHIQEIELRTEEDPDVKPYVQETEVERIFVDLPKEFQEVSKILKNCFNSKLMEIKNYGHLPGSISSYNKVTLLKLQGSFQGQLARGEKDFTLMKSISLLAEAMKIQHSLILIETQGIDATVAYLEKLKEQAKTSKTKAVQNLVSDYNFKLALEKAKKLSEENIEHPKLLALKKVVAKTLHKNKNSKIIIFNQYRDQIVKTKKILDEMGVSSEVFVGQAKKNGVGMSQKEQKKVIEQFKEGKFNCILATSVAEEGLDIPSVDLVVFYEPIPSGIRTVQRRGRTGRHDKGNVVVLITKNTIDEAYRWSAHHKERRMITAIKKLKGEFVSEAKITDFVEENLKIIADHREKGSGVIKELASGGVTLDLKALQVGDYLLSENLCVEFKTIPDFVGSIIDGRLLEQIKGLKQYKKPLIIIEGEEDVYSQRKIHPNAIRGMLATIMTTYNIPVFQTKNPQDTAAFLKLLAKREQEGKGADFQYHSSKPLTLKERQEYLVAALPGIGNKLAKPLLEEFGSIKGIVNASEEGLQKVDLIGKKKAKEIKDLFEARYDKK